MRIVHLTTLHAPLDVRIFRKEARTAAAAGHEVHVVAPGAEGVRDGVRFHDLGAATEPGIANLAARLRAARRAARELPADVYHMHEPELIPLALTLNGVVYDAHEETPLEVRAMHPDRPLFGRALSVGWRSAERLVGAAADGIVAATPSIATRFREQKTIVVRNFPTAEEAAGFVGGPHAERPPSVAYLGGVTAIRGAREMAAAIERVPEPARLVVAGPVDAGLEFGPRADLRGSLGRDEVAALLREARVGLLLLHPVAAHLESLPIKLFEYMAAGIPVVASDFPLWRELIGAAGVLVDPHDVAAIARAIEDLLADPARAEAIGRAGREAVAERFMWEPEGERLLSLYERVGSSPGRSG